MLHISISQLHIQHQHERYKIKQRALILNKNKMNSENTLDQIKRKRKRIKTIAKRQSKFYSLNIFNVTYQISTTLYKL